MHRVQINATESTPGIHVVASLRQPSARPNSIGNNRTERPPLQRRQEVGTLDAVVANGRVQHEPPDSAPRGALPGQLMPTQLGRDLPLQRALCRRVQSLRKERRTGGDELERVPEVGDQSERPMKSPAEALQRQLRNSDGTPSLRPPPFGGGRGPRPEGGKRTEREGASGRVSDVLLGRPA